MDAQLARKLIACNNEFYRHHAASFSATRQAPWQGWTRIAETAQALAEPAGPLRVLDVACGNLRFERFLAERMHTTELSCLAVDSTPELADDAPALRGVCTRTVDVLEALLDTLVRHTRTGGVIALSLWQFMNDPRLARKAEAAEAAMREQGFPVNALAANDHFLGWQNSIQPVRYCHHFCESEVDALSTHLTQLGAREIARFSADGRSGTLNRYLICQVERPSRL